MTRPTRLTPHFLTASALLAWGVAPSGLVPGAPAAVREALRNDLPSRSDYERMERGYYEQLLDAGRQPDAPSRANPVAPARSRATETGDFVKVDDVREYVLKPGLKVTDPGRRIAGATNRHGMRDRDYTVARPAGTFRVALVGDSIAAGWGVGDEEGFEPRLERAFDARSRAAGGPAVEVLNFAVPGHAPGQRWSHFDTVGWAFSPDLVLYEATPADPGWDERRLRVLLARGVGLDAPVYRDVLSAAGVTAGLDPAEYKARLRPLRWDILSGVYRAVVDRCHRRGVPAAYVLIPRVGKPADPADRRRLLGLAREAGFDAVIDACDAYEGAEAADLAVAPNDFHPNAEGHARIARRVEAELAARPGGLTGPWPRPSATPSQPRPEKGGGAG